MKTVTMDGEMSGHAQVHLASFWGKIIQIDNGEEYTIADNVEVI
jgi:hypothetical protein